MIAGECDRCARESTELHDVSSLEVREKGESTWRRYRACRRCALDLGALCDVPPMQGEPFGESRESGSLYGENEKAGFRPLLMTPTRERVADVINASSHAERSESA